jgi:hypothetical protein
MSTLIIVRVIKVSAMSVAVVDATVTSSDRDRGKGAELRCTNLLASCTQTL